MSPTDDDDYLVLKSERGLIVCKECEQACEEVGALRMCFRCDGFEDPSALGRITKVLKRLPEAHPLFQQFKAEGLTGLLPEEVAIAIWDDAAAQATNPNKEPQGMTFTSTKSERAGARQQHDDYNFPSTSFGPYRAGEHWQIWCTRPARA